MILESLFLVEEGLDDTSEFGGNIVMNDDFIIVSGNGYNYFNGIVKVYYNNVTIENKLVQHSIIKCP